MTSEDQFIQRLEGYLDDFEGPTPLPGAVREAIRAELPRTRQVGSLPGPMKLLRMAMQVPSRARYGLVAAALLAAAVLGASAYFANRVGGPADPTPTPLPLATPGALPSAAALQPGTYRYDKPSTDLSDYRFITFTLPAGWATSAGLIYKHLDEPSEVALSFWSPGEIYLNGCRWETSAAIDVNEAGHTDNEQGDIVLQADHPLLNQREVMSTTNVLIGAERALRLELRLPREIDIAACDSGEYRSWSSQYFAGEPNSHHQAGQVDLVYFVDVDRRPLFIDASYGPDASAQDRAELQGILDSMVIDRGL